MTDFEKAREEKITDVLCKTFGVSRVEAVISEVSGSAPAAVPLREIADWAYEWCQNNSVLKTRIEKEHFDDLKKIVELEQEAEALAEALEQAEQSFKEINVSPLCKLHLDADIHHVRKALARYKKFKGNE